MVALPPLIGVAHPEARTMVPGGVGGVWANPVDERNATKTAREMAEMFMAAISKLATKKADPNESAEVAGELRSRH